MTGRPDIILFIAGAMTLFPATMSAQLDSAVTDALGTKLAEYVSVIETEPSDVKCSETDFLIGSCTDSLVRQFTAVTLYGHYAGSPLMGDETVAIHIFDKWFAPGKVKMQTGTDFMNARIFAEFNRQSLIGCKAPELDLETMQGTNAVLFGDNGSNGRLSILFFYDSGCSTCKMESIMLRSILRDRKYRLNLFAVYTGQSETEWRKFAEDYLAIDNPGIGVSHLWDPEIRSDFQMKYGILQTPRLFLVSGSGIIIGRRLDTLALKELLDIYSRPYEYGNAESSAFFDGLFAGYGENPVCDTVKKFCDDMALRTLGEKDTLSFRHLAGDFMYWLGTQMGEGIKCGLSYLIDRYISGMPEIWTESEDSLKILAYSEILGDLLGKSAAGQKLPAIRTEGKLLSGGKERTVTRRLDRLKNTTVIFHTEGCGFCEAELAAADSLSKSGRRKFFTVDIDSLIDRDPDAMYRLFDAVDLSVMPYITVTDGKGRVSRKYVSLK